MALKILQGKVLPEVLEKFKESQEQSGSETFNQFVEEILEAYLNPKTKPVEVPRPTEEQLQEIQLKENEIGRLKMQIDFKEKELSEANGKIGVLNEQVFNLSENQASELLENQVLITIPPIMDHVLKIEQETAKNKSGKEFSLGDILLNNFWESIVNGASYPFRIWSRLELSQLAKRLKEQEQ